MKDKCEAFGPLASCGKKAVEEFKNGSHPFADRYWLCREHYDKAVKRQKKEGILR